MRLQSLRQRLLVGATLTWPRAEKLISIGKSLVTNKEKL
jgi:hypothetical protein